MTGTQLGFLIFIFLLTLLVLRVPIGVAMFISRALAAIST